MFLIGIAWWKPYFQLFLDKPLPSRMTLGVVMLFRMAWQSPVMGDFGGILSILAFESDFGRKDFRFHRALRSFWWKSSWEWELQDCCRIPSGFHLFNSKPGISRYLRSATSVYSCMPDLLVEADDPRPAPPGAGHLSATLRFWDCRGYLVFPMNHPNRVSRVSEPSHAQTCNDHNEL